jgi:hypothetical protein
MRRVTGIGGIFMSARDPKSLCAWYKKHLEKTDELQYGKFGWVMDPEGNKVELWEPPERQ